MKISITKKQFLVCIVCVMLVIWQLLACTLIRFHVPSTGKKIATAISLFTDPGFFLWPGQQ
jgi:hypothetical protein